MLASLILTAVVITVGLWVRSTRVARKRWLTQLALPGLWLAEDDNVSLELRGGLQEGKYVFVKNDAREKGRWRLNGDTLELSVDAGELRRYDLRYFDKGYIGLQGSHALLLRKQPTNVVPLRGLR